MPRVVLVTGVSRYLGGRLATLMQADPAIERVIGVDVVPPRADLGRTEFVRADIRNPIITKVLASAEVDTVVHMNVVASVDGAGGRMSMKEINVIGSMQLLAACQKAPSVRTLVVKSTSAVYGSSARDPALFTEEMEPRAVPRSGYAKDAFEVESYVRGFARRRPDVAVTVLRFTDIVGPRIETPLTRYFSLPVIPTVLGFDPRLQFTHEDDGIEVLRLAASGEHPGIFNVSGPGVLPLSQAARRAGRPTVPLLPAALAPVGRVLRRARLVDFSAEQVRFLHHGRAVDIGRLREDFGSLPRYSTRQAFDDFVHGRALRSYLPQGTVAEVERVVLGALAQRRTIGA
ncbi:MAG: NAD-dependent epimerase/dehydratase family protein [Mycobacterium leprae]